MTRSSGTMFWRRLRRNRAALVGGGLVIFFIVLALFADVIAPYDPMASNFRARYATPSWEHWLGADGLGRDMLSRIIHGARYSLLSGLISVGIAFSIGSLLGLVAGYFRGIVDTIIMRIMDVILAFPGILLAIAIISVLGRGLTNAMIAVGIYSIPAFARVLRSSVLEKREEEYVQAARASGSSSGRLIFRHVLPNAIAPVLVLATMRLGSAILAAASLSFVGLGAQPPMPEWGAMLSAGRDVLRTAPHVTLFPGIAILLTVIGFNLFGDGLRDALDPKSRG